MITAEAASAFHCPRWDELPTLSLYMDQVVIVLEEALPIFAGEGEKVVTSTMINNYVKQRLIHPPEKKKYGRKQLAVIIVVSVLKRVCSMSEITTVVGKMVEEYGPEEAYNLFCTRLEETLADVFSGKTPKINAALGGEGPVQAMEAAFAALAGKLYLQTWLETHENALT